MGHERATLPVPVPVPLPLPLPLPEPESESESKSDRALVLSGGTFGVRIATPRRKARSQPG